MFAFAILDQFEGEDLVNIDKIRRTVGAYFCLSNEGLELLVDKTCEKYNEFTYKDDAGLQQLSIKTKSSNFTNTMLKNHYGIQE